MLLISQQQLYKTTSTSWINVKVGDKVTVELEMTASSLENRSECLCDQNKKEVVI